MTKQKTAKEGSSLYNKGIVTDALIGILNSIHKIVDCILLDIKFLFISRRIIKHDMETLSVCIVRKVAHYYEYVKEDNNGHFKWKSYR